MSDSIRQEQPADGSANRKSQQASQRDYRMDRIISVVLRGGVLLSAGLLILGAMLYFARVLSGRWPVHPLSYPHSLSDVFAGLAHGEPLAIVALGLLVLLLTPVVRVAISIFVFARERDWLYVGITTLVLLILLVSFLLGTGRRVAYGRPIRHLLFFCWSCWPRAGGLGGSLVGLGGGIFVVPLLTSSSACRSIRPSAPRSSR